jgi:dTDP-4-amino-4,6-dideoxy-D-galactose acyltransferase
VSLSAQEPCELLPWDTDHFGFTIARVRGETLTADRAEQVDAWCARAGVVCLYWLAAPGDADSAATAEARGFREADLRLVFARSLEPANSEPLPTGLRFADPADTPRLVEIARTSYRLTRFYFDPKFPKARVEALYTVWIDRSLAGMADAVLVAGPVGEPTGFITCHRAASAESARIGLVGVDARSQGQGIGPILLRGAIEWFRDTGASRVEVATQGRNLSAQRLYQRGGFVSDSVKVWYHKWYR